MTVRTASLLIWALSPGLALAANTADFLRIGATVQSPGSPALGDPRIITWSIVPDGISVPGTFTDPGANPTPTSDLIASLDDEFSVPVIDRTPDLTNRPWFTVLQETFANYSRKTGLDYVYVTDDGAAFPNSIGAAGLRGDLRLAATELSGVLGYNGIPAGSTVPDMVLDSSFPWTGATLKLIVGHEHAHGLGLDHLIVNGDASLSVVSQNGGNGNGPQFDDLLPLHRKYGDKFEKGAGNDTRLEATPLGRLHPGSILVAGDGVSGLTITSVEADFVSVDGSSDLDFFGFTLATTAEVHFTLAPRGPSYSYVPEGGSSQSFNALTQSNLRLQVLDGDGLVLHDIDGAAIGATESFTTSILETGDYTVRVSGTENAAQMYSLTVAVPDTDGDGTSDAVESATGRDFDSAADLAFEFDNDGDFEGWVAGNQILSPLVFNGSFQGTSESADPKRQQELLNFPGAEVPHLAVRLRSSANNQDTQLFWAISGANNFSPARRMDQTYTGNGDWQVLVFDLSTDPLWSAETILRLRLDPINASGATFEIDWIRASDGDFDQDGLPDDEESTGDADGDGLPDWRDHDADGDGTPDGAELLAGRNPLDPADLAFEFNTDGDFEGWTDGNNILNPTVSGGVFSGEAINVDPIRSNTVLHFAGSSAPDILVRLKADSNAGAQLFWANTSNVNFAPARSETAPYTGNGNWQLVRFTPATIGQWSGVTIIKLRLDPIAAAGATFEVDWIRASDGDLDDDGIPDVAEGAEDIDLDGLANLEDLDSDGDGAHDTVENFWGRNPYAAVEDGIDTDGDGRSDLLEMIAGHSPDDASDAFVATVSFTGAGPTLRGRVIWSGKAGRSYLVEGSITAPTGGWETLNTIGPLGADAQMSADDPLTVADQSSRLYRIRATHPLP